MGYAAYPNGNDLQQFLSGAGILTIPPTATEALADLNALAMAGRQRLEERTNRIFLAVSGSRSFDPPRTQIVDLREDLAQLTSLTVSGTAKVLNTDFRLLPQNADQGPRPKPFSLVEFAAPIYYLRAQPANWNAIVVTGSWGYSLTIPEDAWHAMLLFGAERIATQMGAAKSEGLDEIRLGDHTFKFGSSGAWSSERAAFRAQFEEAVKTYRNPKAF